ncbi:hypothetical protein BT96DRAFT_1017793 [Gymnopus androsaceus JB14]|uniref:Uncharacterized protein n=1 Tax=Gymnopus androsaceus JB14 TaxID=1447944 RepID=A0A6A4HWH5_9AGAR|nr:hypothetical protein BT96DRAFT_1017793 [Gymnopus androsaceus JB14]
MAFQDASKKFLYLWLFRKSASTIVEEASFARGHSPALVDLGLTQQIMLNFVDGLNLAMAASPPLRIVGASGPVVVRIAGQNLPGNSMQIDPQANNRTLLKSLSDLYLKAANINVFKPRGLVARICTTSAMLILLSKSSREPSDDAIKKVGRGALTVAQHMPITYLVRQAIKAREAKKLESTKEEALYQPLGQRRLALIEGRALPTLSAGGFPPQTTQSITQITSRCGVSLSGAMREEKKDGERRRAMARFEEAGVSNGNNFIDHSVGRGARTIARAERRRAQTGGQGRQLRLELPNGDEGALLETWAADRLLWVVIMPVEKDADIEDIIIAEDPANEECVDHSVWMGEMLFESEEMADGFK